MSLTSLELIPTYDINRCKNTVETDDHKSYECKQNTDWVWHLMMVAGLCVWWLLQLLRTYTSYLDSVFTRHRQQTQARQVTNKQTTLVCWFLMLHLFDLIGLPYICILFTPPSAARGGILNFTVGTFISWICNKFASFQHFLFENIFWQSQFNWKRPLTGP